MKEFIAYCGLNCETCKAHMAAMNNDDTRRKKVAELWSELNGVEITPEMINFCISPSVFRHLHQMSGQNFRYIV